MKPLLNLKPEPEAVGTARAVDPVVTQLRQRLIQNEYADSLEVRITLLAEMIYRAYISTQK